ncbi:MAG: hypothetical protein HQK53_10540 [Oligoflexia bacterium]|nr:hypothetical protein [Oligoflexia bacterium]
MFVARNDELTVLNNLLKKAISSLAIFRGRHHIGKSSNWLLVIAFLLAAILLVKMVIFANNFGGIEQDSGWYLGISKNLAFRGIYATFVNTEKTDASGVGKIENNLHQKPHIHDEYGYNHFYSGTIGPGFIIPQAIVYKFFGYHWWTHRIYSQAAMFGLLWISFYILLKWGGVCALASFFFIIWSVPTFTIGFSFESFSEALATLYMLISIVLLVYAMKTGMKSRSQFQFQFRSQSLLLFFSGFFVGLAYLTKTITLLLLISYFILYGFIFCYSFYYGFCYSFGCEYNPPFNKHLLQAVKRTIQKLLMIVLGTLLPIVCFELYRFIYIFTKFGLEAYYANNLAAKLTMQRDGSGISDFHFSWDFFYRKLIFWQDLGITSPIFLWVVFFLTLFLALRILWFQKEKHKCAFISIILVFIVLNLVWFLIVSPTGWFRHVWYTAYLGLFIFS